LASLARSGQARVLPLLRGSIRTTNYEAPITNALGQPVHMNGRIYDPLLGRFLSADPYIQFSGNLQSYNRYSYVMNNPLSATDPTGYVGNYANIGGANYRGGAVITSAQARAAGKFVVDSFTEPITEPFSILKSGLTGSNYLTPGERTQFITFGTIALGAAVIEGAIDVVSGGAAKPAKSVARKGMREIAETVVERAAADVGGESAENLAEASIKSELKDTVPVGKSSGHPEAEVGDKVYRNWGGKSGPNGESWTRDPINQQSRDSLGLGRSNTGEFVSSGTLVNTDKVTTREALEWGEFKGKGDEVLVPDAAKQIKLDSVIMPDNPLPDSR